MSMGYVQSLWHLPFFTMSSKNGPQIPLRPQTNLIDDFLKNPIVTIFGMPACGNWTLMVGEGGGWAKVTKIIMAFFGHLMVKLYLNN